MIAARSLSWPIRGHQILQARAAGCREVIPGLPEVVKVQASAPIARMACGQADILLKLLRRSGPPLTPAKMSASAPGPTKRDRCSRTAGMIDEGMPTMRQAALDFAGPSTSSPVDRSA